MGLRILIHGGRGRMGHAVGSAAKEMGIDVAASVDVGDDVAAGLARADVAIDFSAHSATRSLLELAVAQRRPVVLGTTGHTPEEKKQLVALAARVPCVWAGNFSVGVNLLFALTRRAAAVLGADYDAEVI
jgi:4-hydroxy-tetrahydrodipicolinate reductase